MDNNNNLLISWLAILTVGILIGSCAGSDGYNGIAGKAGKAGADGADGICLEGADGKDGRDGVDGEPGADGHGLPEDCFLVYDDKFMYIECEAGYVRLSMKEYKLDSGD